MKIGRVLLGRGKEPISSEGKEARCCAGMEDFAYDAAMRDPQIQPTADGGTERTSGGRTLNSKRPYA